VLGCTSLHPTYIFRCVAPVGWVEATRPNIHKALLGHEESSTQPTFLDVSCFFCITSYFIAIENSENSDSPSQVMEYQL